MLSIMTLVGVTTMTGSTLQERIAGNQRQKMLARANADRGLRAAETVLDGLHFGGFMRSKKLQETFDSTNGLYSVEPIVNNNSAKPLSFVDTRVNRTAWNSSNSVAVPNEDNVLSRYVIEYMGATSGSAFFLDGNFDDGFGGKDDLTKRKVFRITAIGFADNPSIYSVLESYYFEEGGI
jgi:type IV pilus assembly protein PilX